ncbi:MAG TPA: hypothetical protein VG411_11745, partial [Actinomycetota bacterium]|nr:hypothetical protein [Actinomycetota bacterium]
GGPLTAELFVVHAERDHAWVHGFLLPSWGCPRGRWSPRPTSPLVPPGWPRSSGRSRAPGWSSWS